MIRVRSAVVTVAAVLALATPALADDDDAPEILDWKTMAGVQAPFTGAANPIRGVQGGGAPWDIARGEGELHANGELEVEVRGLVLSSTGVNPSPTFRAIVSCMTTAVDPATNALTAVVANVPTGEFPATATGDAKIEAALELPDPCYAPIVFVTNAALRWFAVTGNSSAD